MKKIASILFILTMGILLAGCQSSRQLPAPTAPTLPEAFAGLYTSANVARVNWRTYFSDPYLQACVDTALHNNWDVRTAFQRIQIARADLRIRQANRLPGVDLAVSAGQQKFGAYTMDGAGNVGTYIEDDKEVPTHLRDFYGGLQLSWEADIWGRLRNQKRAAVHRFLASLEARNAATTMLIATVAIQYANLIALDRELVILNETIALQTQAVDLVQAQMETGRVNALAVRQLEAQLLHAKSDRVETQRAIVNTENELNLLLGRYPQPIARSNTFLKQDTALTLTVGVPEELLLHRPDVREAEQNLAAAHADVRAARAAFYPSLQINGDIGYQAYRTGLLFKTPESYVYDLFASLSTPLINRAAIKAQFQQANASQQEALYAYQSTVVGAYIEVCNEVVGIQKIQEMEIFKQAEVSTLLQSVETSLDLFRMGRASYLEVIMAQQNALQARLELVHLQKSRMQAATLLYKALGGGWQ